MPKFKPGDKVRIHDGSKIENYTGLWASHGGMNKYVGTIQTIIKVHEVWPDGRVSYCMEDIGYVWDERGLELVDEQPKIVITTDGRVTKATMYEGNQRIKIATSTCHPEDKFDFLAGAKIALDRLINATSGKHINETKKFNWKGFKAGKFKVHVSKENSFKFLKECEKRNINWGDHKASEWNPYVIIKRMPFILKSLTVGLLDFDEDDDVYFIFENGYLKFTHHLLDSDKAVEYND